MNPHYNHYKALFEFALDPFMQMLTARQSSMELHDWVRLVSSVQAGITNSPEQYLGKDLPDPNITATIIAQIFGTFLERQYPLVALEELHRHQDSFLN